MSLTEAGGPRCLKCRGKFYSKGEKRRSINRLTARSKFKISIDSSIQLDAQKITNEESVLSHPSRSWQEFEKNSRESVPHELTERHLKSDASQLVKRCCRYNPSQRSVRKTLNRVISKPSKGVFVTSSLKSRLNSRAKAKCAEKVGRTAELKFPPLKSFPCRKSTNQNASKRKISLPLSAGYTRVSAGDLLAGDSGISRLKIPSRENTFLSDKLSLHTVPDFKSSFLKIDGKQTNSKSYSDVLPSNTNTFGDLSPRTNNSYLTTLPNNIASYKGVLPDNVDIYSNISSGVSLHKDSLQQRINSFDRITSISDSSVLPDNVRANSRSHVTPDIHAYSYTSNMADSIRTKSSYVLPDNNITSTTHMLPNSITPESTQIVLPNSIVPHSTHNILPNGFTAGFKQLFPENTAIGSKHMLPDIVTFNSTHGVLPDNVAVRSTHGMLPDNVAFNSTHDVLLDNVAVRSTHDMLPDNVAVGSTHGVLPDNVAVRSTHGVLPDNVAVRSTHDVLLDNVAVRSTHDMLPDNVAVGSTHGVLPDNVAVRSTHGVLPDNVAVRSTHGVLPDNVAVRSTHGVLPDSVAVRSTHGVLPDNVAIRSTHGVLPDNVAVRSTHDMLPDNVAVGSTHGVLPDNVAVRSTHGVLPNNVAMSKFHISTENNFAVGTPKVSPRFLRDWSQYYFDAVSSVDSLSSDLIVPDLSQLRVAGSSPHSPASRHLHQKGGWMSPAADIHQVTGPYTELRGLNIQSKGDATKLEILPPLSQGENVAVRGDYVVSIGDVFPETVPKSSLSDTDFVYEFLDDFGTESVYFLSVEADRADHPVTSEEALGAVSLKSIFENRNPVRHDLESSIKELKREEKKRLNQEMAMRDGRVAIQQHLQYEWLNLKRLREAEDEMKSDPLKGSEYYDRRIEVKDKMEAVCDTITELLLSESKKAAYEQYIHSTREAIQEQISHRKQLKLEEVDESPLDVVLPAAASKESVESDSLSESASKSSYEYLPEIDESNLLSVKRVSVSGSFEKLPAAAAEPTKEENVRRDDSDDTVTGETSKGSANKKRARQVTRELNRESSEYVSATELVPAPRLVDGVFREERRSTVITDSGSFYSAHSMISGSMKTARLRIESTASDTLVKSKGRVKTAPGTQRERFGNQVNKEPANDKRKTALKFV